MGGPAPRLPLLRPNQLIHDRFIVQKKLGEGGFGAVYKVESTEDNPPRQYAIKLESVNAKVQVLKMEVFVLEQVHGITHKCDDRSHFCRIEAKGRTESYNYVVMTLVGPSLYNLKKNMPALKFSWSTAVRSGLQCLEAVRDLHSVGYLHRDLKPSNYCVGNRATNEHRSIFLLDFGMCRKFVNPDGRVRTPRAVAGFRGTTRYVSLNCHLGWEQARKDDLETWFYQQVELTKPHLPWRVITDKDQVKECKQQCRAMPARKEFLKGCPEEYGTIIDYIDSLKYWDDPDYDLLCAILTKITKEHNFKDDDFYDWEKSVDELPGPSPEDAEPSAKHKHIESKKSVHRARRKRRPSQERGSDKKRREGHHMKTRDTKKTAGESRRRGGRANRKRGRGDSRTKDTRDTTARDRQRRTRNKDTRTRDTTTREKQTKDEHSDKEDKEKTVRQSSKIKKKKK